MKAKWTTSLFVLVGIVAGMVPTRSLVNEMPVSGMEHGRLIVNRSLDFSTIDSGNRQSRIAEAQARSYPYTDEIYRLLLDLERRGHARNVHRLWIIPGVIFEGDNVAFTALMSSPVDGWVDLDPERPALLEDMDALEPFSAMETADWDTMAWGVRRSKASSVWSRFGITGRGVRVAIFDTGIQPNHPDLIDNLWGNSGEIPHNGIDDDDNGYVDDYNGYDFVYDREQYDDRGHGTHVAGTVAGIGRAGMKSGVAPEARLMALKVINDEGSGIIGNSWRAVEYALLMDAQIASMSIGWTYREGLDRGGWRAVIENAKDLGLFFSISAGNEGGSEESCLDLRCPGDVPDAFSIGACNTSGYYVSFSAVGPVCWSDIDPYYDYPFPPGLIKPDIIAPGDDIPSCALTGTYIEKGGTSMATPHISGIAALIMQLDTTVTPEYVEAIMESTAVDMGTPGQDNRNGWGRVDAETAIEMALGYLGHIRIQSQPGVTFRFEPKGMRMTTDEYGYLTITARGSESTTFTGTRYGFLPDSGSAVFSPDTTLVTLMLTPSDSFALLIEVLDMETLEPIEASVFTESGDTADYSEGYYTGLWCHVFQPMTVICERSGYRREAKTFPNDLRPKRFFLRPADDLEDLPDYYFDGDFEWGTPAGTSPLPRSGVSLMATGLSENYTDLSDSRILTPFFSVYDSTAMLTFYHWYEIEATSWGLWDGGNVQVQTPGSDTTWQILYPRSLYPGHLDDFNEIMPWQPAISGTLWGLWWQQEEFPLADYAGDSVRFMFRFSSDENTNFRGWYIDDILCTPTELIPPVIDNVLTDISNDTLSLFCEAIGIYSPIDTTAVLFHFTITDLAGAATTDSIPMEWSIGTDGFNASVTLPFYAEVDYYFSARDEAELYTRYPTDSSFSSTFGGDTIPPAIHFPWLWHQVWSPDSFFIRAVIKDSLSGIDTSSIELHLITLSGTYTLRPFSSVADTFFFGYHYELLGYTRFILSASDLFETPNTSVTDTMIVRYAHSTNYEAYSDTSAFRDIGESDIFYFDTLPSPRWNADFYETGVDSLVIRDINLAGCRDGFDWIEATLFICIEYDIPAGGGFDFHTQRNILFPFHLDEYDEFVPALMNDGYVGESPLRCFDLNITDYTDEIFDFILRVASPGGEGSFWIDYVHISGHDGVSETRINIPIDLDICISPNPANSAFSIDAPTGTPVSIYNVRGELVHKRPEGGSFIWQPDSDLPSGIYIVTSGSTSRPAVLIR